MRPARRCPAPPVTAGERRQSPPPPSPPAVTSGERRQMRRCTRLPVTALCPQPPGSGNWSGRGSWDLGVADPVLSLQTSAMVKLGVYKTKSKTKKPLGSTRSERVDRHIPGGRDGGGAIGSEGGKKLGRTLEWKQPVTAPLWDGGQSPEDSTSHPLPKLGPASVPRSRRPGGVSRVSAQAPSRLGRADRGPRATAPPSSYSTMGSCGAVGSVRARYLVFFQYLGTDFNGVAAVRGNRRAVGVQNFLEEAATRLNSVEPIRFTISSRTDAGVHALSNAAHLDIHRRSGLQPYSPEVVTQALNTHLKHRAIRVLKAFRVPDDFHARHAATSRTYLYRLATGCPWPDQLPVFEQNVCWALQTKCLDVAAMQEAAHHLIGTHDFSAFQSAGSPAASTVRTLQRVSVSSGPASPFVLPQESRKLQFWTLEFESQSFLYRQVRRMTAVLVAVGQGTLTPTQVKAILDSQDPLGKYQARVAPARGLFLKSVLYDDFGPAS